MDTAWKDRWDERYSKEEFAYGTNPNCFLKEQLDLLQPTKILFAAEGEGRNAVYAAIKGWDVSAFDISIEGQKKAEKLAKEKGISIQYEIGELQNLNYKPKEFQVIALIFAHFPAPIKSNYHLMLDLLLADDGLIIFEAFSKNHIKYNSVNPAIGGPKEIDDLFSIEEIKSDFSNYEILLLEEKEIKLEEGIFHNGKGSVIRFVGRKKSNK